MKKLLSWLIPALFVVTVHAAGVTDITIPELKAAIATQKVVLIDANDSESWQKGHIAGALDFEATKAKLAALLPQDKNAPIVAYCGGPKCMAYKAAAAAALKLGYTNVKHLPDGIKGWIAAGEPVEKRK